MFNSDTSQDNATWSITDIVCYPNMANSDQTRAQASNQGPALPVASKWKSFSAGLPFLTLGQSWLNKAVIETFRGFSKGKDLAEPTMVYGMDCYNIFLYLSMEVLQITVLLCNSTVAKKFHLRRYAIFLKQINSG